MQHNIKHFSFKKSLERIFVKNIKVPIYLDVFFSTCHYKNDFFFFFITETLFVEEAWAEGPAQFSCYYFPDCSVEPTGAWVAVLVDP